MGEVFIQEATLTIEDTAPAPAVSPASTARLYYDDASGMILVSVNGGAYAPLGGGGSSPGGANTQVQYNSAGSFAGSANFTFDGTSVTLAAALFANAGVDRSSSSQLNLGTVNASTVQVGAGNAVNLGGSSVAARLSSCGINLADNTNSVFHIVGSGSTALRINTLSADRIITIGADPGGAGIFRTDVVVRDNVSQAFVVTEGSHPYVSVSTVNGAEELQLGNSTLDAVVTILGNNKISLFGHGVATTGPYLSFQDRSADPGGVAGLGQLYVKVVAGVTQLFFQRSDGTVVQIT